MGKRGPKWWRNRPRWFRRLVLASTLSFFLMFVALVGIVYAATKVPLPQNVDTAQTSVITYSNGQTIATIGTVNRTDVGLNEVSLAAQHAVLAAEDRNFYHEPGISYRGIARALYTNLRGGGISQGGSTITQQYAKNAYLTQQRTFSRKIREIVLAVKLDRKYSKDQILEFYLNTIYFGRGAYGIQAASQAYFGIDASKLTAEQGAVIAGLIRSPNVLDPRVSPKSSAVRWHEVIDTMVKQGWLTPAQGVKDKTPPVTKPKVTDSQKLNAQAQYIRQEVKTELNQHGISDDVINQDGLRITTTLDQAKQTNAYLAVTSTLRPQAGVPDLRTGLVALQPGTGRILAWYGGSIYGKGPGGASQYVDNVSGAEVQPGSSFKPIVLAAALSKGISMNSFFQAPASITPTDTKDLPVINDEKNVDFGSVNLITATAESINTVYVPLVGNGTDPGTVGVHNVIQMATQLGIPASETAKFKPSQRVALGEDNVHAVDMAAVYGTFASGGTEATPHIVDSVRDRTGKIILTGDGQPKKVLDSGVDADATYAMQQVIESPGGTGGAARLANGRPAAGKTGTVEGFRYAWFCGYTPTLASCVNMLRGAGSTKATDALTGFPGASPGVYGGGLPAQVWKAFMDAALMGTPNQPFPPPVNGGTVIQASPSPSPSSLFTIPGLNQPTRRPRPGQPSSQPTASVSPSGGPTGVPTGPPTPILPLPTAAAPAVSQRSSPVP